MNFFLSLNQYCLVTESSFRPNWFNFTLRVSFITMYSITFFPYSFSFQWLLRLRNFQDFPTPNVFYLNANVTHCNFIHIDFLTVAYISQSICSMREIIKRSLRKVYTTYIARLALSQE